MLSVKVKVTVTITICAVDGQSRLTEDLPDRHFQARYDKKMAKYGHIAAMEAHAPSLLTLLVITWLDAR